MVTVTGYEALFSLGVIQLVCFSFFFVRLYWGIIIVYIFIVICFWELIHGLMSNIRLYLHLMSFCTPFVLRFFVRFYFPLTWWIVEGCDWRRAHLFARRLDYIRLLWATGPRKDKRVVAGNVEWCSTLLKKACGNVSRIKVSPHCLLPYVVGVIWFFKKWTPPHVASSLTIRIKPSIGCHQQSTKLKNCIQYTIMRRGYWHIYLIFTYAFRPRITLYQPH